MNSKEVAKRLREAKDSTDYHNCVIGLGYATTCYDKDKVEAIIDALEAESESKKRE